MRTFGVEEELLLVDAASLQAVPVALEVLGSSGPSAGIAHLTAELQQEQLEVISAPQLTVFEQLATIRASRASADAAASALGARVVALATAPCLLDPHLYPNGRYLRIADRFQLTTDEQFTNGFHVHVAVASPEEGVAVLDRVREWLHVIIALSANSPFWRGADSGYASYRYQAWTRWPSSGPTEAFGSAIAYEAEREALLRTRVPLDPGMIYFDARLCERYSTVEVRVADVCGDARHAAAIAGLLRALVESCARNWQRGLPAPAVPASVLRVWAWQASRFGVEGELVDPRSGRAASAASVVDSLLAVVRPVLDEYRERHFVESVVAEIVRNGSGASFQRQALRARGNLDDVVAAVLELTHATPDVTPAARAA